MRRSAALCGLVLACTCAVAQVIPSNEFNEGDTPAPPPLKLDGLVPLDMGPGTELRWGVDPGSVSIGADRVVRYVVVAQGQGGAVNALYEGLRCDDSLVRVYARHARDGDWVPATGDWVPMRDNSATRHSLVIARTGACIGHAANRSREQIVLDLGRTANYRFSNEAR